MDKKIISASEVTPEMMAAWTKKYGEGNCAKVSALDQKGVKKVCFLRPPSRTEMGAYSVAYRTNPIKANEYLAKQVWLAGDPEMLTENYLFYSVAEKLPDLVKSSEAELDMF